MNFNWVDRSLPILMFSATIYGVHISESFKANVAAAAQVQRYQEKNIFPDISRLFNDQESALRDVVNLYSADRAALMRRYDIDFSAARRNRLRTFYRNWQRQLMRIDFDALGVEARIDYILLDNEIRYELDLLEREQNLFAEMGRFIPFATTIIALDESRRKLEPIDSQGDAETLALLVTAIGEARMTVTQTLESKDGKPSRIVALRASSTLSELQQRLKRWHQHYAGYDPMFTWWTKAPYERADEALTGYIKFLNEKVVGFKENEDPPIVGDPIGSEGMRSDLIHEIIPYSPEELIAIANREFDWCEKELRRAARDMGFSEDWRAALEKVKTLHMEPGRQPELVRDLAHEAIDFLKERDLVTIPPLAEEVWRLEMMSPDMQKFAPFFLGGEVIRVAFPTDEMSHEEKIMSMRGNNIHFSRATVHHELIPGHHLQGFMTRRYSSHRRVFSTPFWGEGWALYWEMLLWDLGFPKTPEDRMGMLFWRTHRAARIIFSLSFHLGRMNPQECIDFLVDRVGHERANATAEVRRSFNGGYSPLYQAAYMIGGLQIRALHKELVSSGQMTNREFHDAILRGGRMPIELVRARLTNQELKRAFTSSWYFDQDSQD